MGVGFSRAVGNLCKPQCCTYQCSETEDPLASADPWLIRDSTGKAKPLGSLGALEEIVPKSSMFQFGVPAPQATKLPLSEHLGPRSLDEKIGVENTYRSK